MELKVIDMLPGSGKTKSMCEFLGPYHQNKSEKHFIYLSPYVKELDKISNKILEESWTDAQKMAMKSGEYVPEDFGVPPPLVPDDKYTKSSDVLNAIRKGKNVVCSHELFRILSTRKVFWRIMEESHYTLIIDEELPLEKDYKFVGCYPSDLKRFLMQSIGEEPPVVTVDEFGVMQWNRKDREAGKGVFRYIKKDILSGILTYRNDWVKWRVPIEKFALFDDVYLMTYRFEYSQFREIWTGDWSYWHFEGNKIVEGKWQIPPERVANIRRRLKIADEKCYPQLGKEGHYSYSLAWYAESTPYDISMLVDKMQKYVQYGAAGKRLDRTKILWTTFKDYKDKIEEFDIGRNTFRPKRGDVETFVPLNMRASNDYLDRNVVFYLVDRHMGGNGTGSRDQWSLSELLQFLFRTCLRLPDSEEVVYAYIPSDRMRRLLERWLDNLA